MKIILKPESISWNELAECQKKAHQSNKNNGIHMLCADYTGEELYREVKEGFTFVALSDQSMLMGMLSVVFRDVNRWWHKGTAAYVCFIAVAPEFKGRGVYRALSHEAEKEIASRRVDVEYLHTHASNVIARRIYEKDGYYYVRFSPGSGTNYYSVEMAKWLNGAGKNKWLCKFVFAATAIASVILYKPGKIRRF